MWGSVLPSPATNSSSKWAGGGFLSTPQDLVRFGVALLDGKIVNAEIRERMFDPRQTTDGKPNEQNYGLGWRVGQMQYPEGSNQNIRIVHHGGTSVGAQCILLLVPEQEIVVAISANSHTGGSGKLLQTAALIAQQFMVDDE